MPPVTARFTHLGRWLFFLLLTGNVIVCHGCHGDEDNELCAPPPLRREIRNPKHEIRMKPEDTNLKSKTMS
jgi:hypothetical protein